MRKLCLLLFLFYTLYVSAQGNYEVFQIHNSVLVKHRGNSEWTMAHKGMSLGLIDSIHIHKNAHIRILDLRSNEVYRADKSGYFRVKEISDAAKQQSTKLLQALQSQLADNSVHPSSMQMVGATTRGESVSSESSLAKAIIYRCEELCTNNPKHHEGLLLHRHQTEEDLFFSISNTTTEDFCVNIILYNSELKKASLCYVINPAQCDRPYIFLPAQQSIKLSSWRFIPPKESEHYILFATKYTYDSTHLQQILKRTGWKDVSKEDTEDLPELIVVKEM